jgi:hypothetical protein
MRDFIVIRGKCPKWILILDEIKVKMCREDFVIKGFTETTHVKNQNIDSFIIIQKIAPPPFYL